MANETYEERTGDIVHLDSVDMALANVAEITCTKGITSSKRDVERE